MTTHDAKSRANGAAAPIGTRPFPAYAALQLLRIRPHAKCKGERLMHCGVAIRPMSALGQTRTFGDGCSMSALPRKRQIAEVSICPLCAKMYGPAVRYKMDFRDQRT